RSHRLHTQSTLFTYTTLFRSNQPGIDKTKLASIINQYDALIVRGRTKVDAGLIRDSKLKIVGRAGVGLDNIDLQAAREKGVTILDRKSTRLNSSHGSISYAVF